MDNKPECAGCPALARWYMEDAKLDALQANRLNSSIELMSSGDVEADIVALFPELADVIEEGRSRMVELNEGMSASADAINDAMRGLNERRRERLQSVCTGVRLQKKWLLFGELVAKCTSYYDFD